MSDVQGETGRSLGLAAATGIGVGAIVGGGILVLAGVAFQEAGPGALLAFALNGLIALLTALSFAEISSRFPESGGAYLFAKRVLSVRAAFAVGWVLWFAYIVAGVLYMLGFASYAQLALAEGWTTVMGGAAPGWLSGRRAALLLGSLATLGYGAALVRKPTGGGQLATIGKLVVFVIVIAAGALAVGDQPDGAARAAFEPILPFGTAGLLAAMGFSFIALQGFDLVAAVGGEVRQPRRTIPRAMLLSLCIALAIYLPLLFVVSVVGVPEGSSITALSAEHPETVVAFAVGNFMGEAGYWLIIVAAVLSTLSALQANLLAASRVAHSMATDRTLPSFLDQVHAVRGTPATAVYATTLTLLAIAFMVPNLAGAGAAASLIFLISFALAYWTAYLARVRGEAEPGLFRTPAFPLIPVVGGVACAALAAFQALAVPEAGGIAVIWLGLGGLLYRSSLARGAEMTDASAEALDPMLLALRGRNPLVLLPVANPANAPALIGLANALAPRQVGRVLLLTVVPVQAQRPSGEISGRLDDALSAARAALAASYPDGHTPEALITAAPEPRAEIRRIAAEHGCHSLLLGLNDASVREQEALINDVDCDVALLRAPTGWTLAGVGRILVPVGGRGAAHELRARLLASICRGARRELHFVTVLGTDASERELEEARRSTRGLADLRVPADVQVAVLRGADPASALVDCARASGADLMLLGLQRGSRGRVRLGGIARRIARDAPCASLLLSRRR